MLKKNDLNQSKMEIQLKARHATNGKLLTMKI
jgi:hypothetical protein